MMCSVSTYAGILIEPHLGYALKGSTSSINETDSIDNSAWSYSNKYSGPEYGAKLGYQLLGLMAGVSYNHATYTLKDTVTCTAVCSSSTPSYSVKRDDLGVFLGYNAPILVRVWVGYDFSVKEKVTSAVTNWVSVGDWDKGVATELGIGYTAIPFLSLNFTYRMITYTKQFDSASNTESTRATKLKTNEMVLSISAPINVF